MVKLIVKNKTIPRKILNSELSLKFVFCCCQLQRIASVRTIENYSILIGYFCECLVMPFFIFSRFQFAASLGLDTVIAS